MAESLLITSNNNTIASTVIQIISTIVSYTLATSIGRKGMFVAALYYGGTLLVSIVGVPPIIIAGALVLLL